MTPNELIEHAMDKHGWSYAMCVRLGHATLVRQHDRHHLLNQPLLGHIHEGERA